MSQSSLTKSGPPFALGEEDRERLLARMRLAVKRARRSGKEILATISFQLPADVDPSAVVCASRRAGEQWFVFEQPDRGRAALATLGEAAHLSASGTDRFALMADRWREMSAAAVVDPTDGLGSGPIAVGGFAFAPDGGDALHWAGFQPASLIVPEVALTRRAPRRDRGDARAEVRLTLAAMARPDDLGEELMARLERRLVELRLRPCRCSIPRRRGATRSRARCRPSIMRRLFRVRCG